MQNAIGGPIDNADTLYATCSIPHVPRNGLRGTHARPESSGKRIDHGRRILIESALTTTFTRAAR